MSASPSFHKVPEPAAADFELAEGEIHLWAVRLDPSAETVRRLADLLSPDEAERAARFRFERHQRRFTVGRGMLRRLLAGYTGHPPEVLSFRYGPKGKPSLDDAWGGADLSFNLSHSEELALYGFTRSVATRIEGEDVPELGVDVEQLRPMPDAEQIAERFFSASERDALRGVSAAQKAEAFFNCWTRKEAYIKATGDGLSMALDRFDVTLRPGEEARMLSCDGDPAQAGRWAVFHLVPKEGYLGAAMILGGPWRPVCREWAI